MAQNDTPRDRGNDDDAQNGYERDYVQLPAVSEGDEVRVHYKSGQTHTEQSREGVVEEVHVNGFMFDHGDMGYRTSVRDQLDSRVESHRNDPPIRRHLGTLKRTPRGTWRHVSELNRRHDDPEETTVEVLNEEDA